MSVLPCRAPMSDFQHLFSADGPFAGAIANFRSRPQQIAMAERIAAAIAGNSVLVAEAGTGTGKTFAYLAPALLSGGKVVIATGTKTLQDQLFKRDLPTVRDALKVAASIALLKGRANYVCHYHLERASDNARLASREEAAHLRKIVRFATRTTTGDKAECIDVPEDSAAWAAATSTRENCLGQECPNHQECFVLGARAQAMMADIVVVNHHLFFADVMLKDEGMGELLPACNTIIFDEAHQLPEVAGLFFGESISTTQLIDLGRDARMEGISLAKDYTPLQDAAVALDKTTRDLRLAVRGENLRLTAGRAFEDPAFEAALKMLTGAIEELSKQLESQVERGEGLANCLARAQALTLQLRRWRGDEAGVDMVRWVEVYSQALSLNLTPLDIAPIFQRQMEGHPRAWILPRPPWQLAVIFLTIVASLAYLTPRQHVGAARLTIKTAPCCMCRRTCLILIALYIKKRSLRPPGQRYVRRVRQIAAALSCALRCARCGGYVNYWKKNYAMMG